MRMHQACSIYLEGYSKPVSRLLSDCRMTTNVSSLARVHMCMYLASILIMGPYCSDTQCSACGLGSQHTICELRTHAHTETNPCAVLDQQLCTNTCMFPVAALAECSSRTQCQCKLTLLRHRRISLLGVLSCGDSDWLCPCKTRTLVAPNDDNAAANPSNSAHTSPRSAVL